jgi:uncharacterized protein
MKSLEQWQNKPVRAQALLTKIGNKIYSIAPNAEIILFGSQARREASEFSDWDILILTEQEADKNLTCQIRNSLYEIELESDQILSSIVRSKAEWYSSQYSILPLKHVIETEGIIL